MKNLLAKPNPSFFSKGLINGIVEQARTGKAWFYGFWVLVFLLFFGADKHFELMGQNRSMLIPYSVALQKEGIKFSNDYSEPGAYLSLIARADVLLYGNWAPDTIENEMTRFSNRLCPELRGEVEPELLNTARLNSEREVTQSLVIDGDIKFDGDVMQVPARLKITAVGEPQTKNRVYNITYSTNQSNGWPMICGFEEKVGEN